MVKLRGLREGQEHYAAAVELHQGPSASRRGFTPKTPCFKEGEAHIKDPCFKEGEALYQGPPASRRKGSTPRTPCFKEGVALHQGPPASRREKLYTKDSSFKEREALHQGPKVVQGQATIQDIFLN